MGKAGPGYRKPKTRKYFTKKDIISTIIVVAIIAMVVAVIAVMISRDDFIRITDGKLEMEDNWLIANYSESSRAMYYKVGEVGQIDGYTLDAGSAQSTIKSLTPDSDDALIKAIYVGTYGSDYNAMAEQMAKLYSGVTGPVEITCAGRDARLIYGSASGQIGEAEDTDAADEAEELEDEAAAEDTWVMIAYIDYDDGHCVYIQLNSDVELSQAEIEAQLATVADALTLVDR